MQNKLIILTIIMVYLLMPAAVSAAGIGVGVGTAEIRLNEVLQPSKSYPLPPITVVNTGTIKSKYKFYPTYFETQPELRPPVEWFKMSPAEFELEPNKTQAVSIELTIPIDAKTGSYFAFMEAGVLKGENEQNSSIGVAAATKLRFEVNNPGYVEVVKTIVQDNVNSNLQIYVLVGLALALLIGIFLFRKFVKVSVSVKEKKKNSSTDYF